MVTHRMSDKRIHHPLLGEVDIQDGPTMLQDVAAEPLPDPPEIAPEEPVEDGIWFAGPEPSEPNPRERIDQRLQDARRRASGIAIRALRMLADHIEK